MTPTEINPACCREEECGMAGKCGTSETPHIRYVDIYEHAMALDKALAESRAECERLNKELQAASIDYRGCMLDRAEYLRRMREAEAECERLRKAYEIVVQDCRNLTEKVIPNIESREREAYERAAKVCESIHRGDGLAETMGDELCGMRLAAAIRALSGERREG